MIAALHLGLELRYEWEIKLTSSRPSEAEPNRLFTVRSRGCSSILIESRVPRHSSGRPNDRETL